MDRHADFLFQNCLEEDARGWAKPILQQQELIRGPQWLVLMPALSIEQASDKPRRIDDAERA